MSYHIQQCVLFKLNVHHLCGDQNQSKR